MKLNRLAICTLFLFVLSSCAVQKTTVVPYLNIKDQIKNSPINQQHQVGFMIKEIGADKSMVEINADHYFTPASNTKLFTFYTALNMLGDSIPALSYIQKKDSLIIWPAADASFLHPDFKEQKAFDFLKNSGKNIYLVTGRYQGEKYGPGWTWDDYNDYYQAEITDLPVYGNMISIKANGKKLKYAPDLPGMFMSELTPSAKVRSAKRSLENNNLTIPSTFANTYDQAVPLHFNQQILNNLLTDTLLATGMVIKPVVNLPWRKIPANAKTIYNTPADSLYKHMLQPSDNFIAEELLLSCAAAKNLTMRTDTVIAYAKQNFLKDLPDEIQWVDGSGLSRLDLFTPRTIVALLQKIYTKVGNEEKLFSLLPNGGKSGTIRNMFKGRPSFVFAKSGSLSNNYNLSGYLIGKSGKKYIFSFMNNSFLNPTADIRKEVERTLTFIHDNY